MPNIILNGQIVADTVTWVSEGDLPDAPVCVTFDYWQQHRDAVLAHGHAKGVLLKADQHPEQIANDLSQLDLIAIEFPAFADGRGYSYAWLLRNRYGFTGELRAVGDVFKDTLFYQQRCGFNSFAVRSDKDIATALKGLADFSQSYQASTDQPLPLFRRRLAS